MACNKWAFASRAWNPICITERRGMEGDSYCQLSWDTYVIVWEWSEGPSPGFATSLAKKRIASSLNVSHPIEWYSEPTNRLEDPSLLALTYGEWTHTACVLCKRLNVREGSETEDNVKFLAAWIIGFFVRVKVIVQYAYTKCIGALCDVL